MQTHETIIFKERDQWGFDALNVHHRGAIDWNAGRGIVSVRVSSEATGHGWGGVITVSTWQANRDDAQAVVVPYRIPDGEDAAETGAPDDCHGWMVYFENVSKPFLFPNRQKAMDAAKAIILGKESPHKPTEPPRSTVYLA